jgi:hypothetical protein
MKKWKKIATYTLIVNMMHPGLSALIKLNIRNLMLNTKNHVPVYSTDINAKQIPNVIMRMKNANVTRQNSAVKKCKK